MKSNNSLFLILSLLVISISCSQSNEPNEKNDVNYLNIKFVSVGGSSNLMPPSSPDPINISANFEFQNQSNEKTLLNINVKESYLLFTTTYGIVGQITMYPEEEIILVPGEKKTIKFYKETSSTKLFEVPCDETIYLKMIIEDSYGNTKELKTANFLYTCSY